MKRPRRKREHGVITVFLSIVLASVIALMGVLVDSARIRVAQAQVKRATQLALDSVMTQYSRSLREDYGLFGMGNLGEEDVNTFFTAYYEQNLSPVVRHDPTSMDRLAAYFSNQAGQTAPTSYGDPLKIRTSNDFVQFLREHTKGELADWAKLLADSGVLDSVNQKLVMGGAVGLYPLSEEEVLFQQIMEFSKYRVPVDMLTSGFADEFAAFQGEMGTVGQDMEANNSMLEAGEKMQAVFDAEDGVRTALKTAREAADAYNDALDAWNALLRGEVEVEVAQPFEVYRYIGDENALTAYFRQSPSAAGASLFTTERWVAAGDTRTMRAYSESSFADAQQDIDGVNDGIWQLYEHYRQQALDETATQVLLAYFDQAEGLAAENDANAAAYRQALRDGYIAAVQEKTQGAAEAVASAWQALENAWKRVGEKLDLRSDSATSARADLKRRDEEDFEACSPEVRAGWAGDYRTYTGILDTSEAQAEKLRAELEKLPQEGAQPDAARTLDAFAGALDGGQAFDASAYMLGGRVARLSDFPQSYDVVSQEEGNAAKDKIKELTKRKAPSDKQEEGRYNPTPMPYANAADDGVEGPDTSDPEGKFDKLQQGSKDTGAEVKGETGAIMGPIGAMTEVLDDVAGALMGPFFASHYLLRMFGNAAPLQENQTQVADPIVYQRVESLRGKEVPVRADADQENGRVGYFWNAEVEYVLYGKNEEKANVDKAKIPLTAICYAANFFHVQRNEAIQSAVETASLALMSATGVPMVVFRAGFYLILAGVETAFDMYYLMRGYKIDVFSMQGDTLFLLHTGDPETLLGKGFFSYEFYLRLQLFCKLTPLFPGTREALMQNLANLMECNIHVREGDESFRIDQAYTSIIGIGGGEMPYWFMTSGIMPEESRQSYGYYPLRPAVAIESY